MGFPAFDQAPVEGAQDRIESHRGHRRHAETAAHDGTPRLDAASTAARSAVVVEWRHPHQGRDLVVSEPAEFGQFGQQHASRGSAHALDLFEAPALVAQRLFSFPLAFLPRVGYNLPELASDGGFFILMSWCFHRGLEPRLQRAHDGRTQAGAGQPATRPESDSEGGDNAQPESEGRSR